MLISKSKFLEKENLFFFTKNQLENSKILMDLTLKRLTDNQVTASVKNSKIQKFKRLRFPWSISFLIRKLDFVHVKLYRGVEIDTFIDRGENVRAHRVKEDDRFEATVKMGGPRPKVNNSTSILDPSFSVPSAVYFVYFRPSILIVHFADFFEHSKPNPKNS